MFPHIYKDDVYDLTFEILPTGVFDTLFDLALVNTREIVGKSVNPLLNNDIVPEDPNLTVSEMDTIFLEIGRLMKLMWKLPDKSRATVIFEKLK